MVFYAFLGASKYMEDNEIPRHYFFSPKTESSVLFCC